jgi:ABC-2 type transport system ATP-binding protein
MPAAEIISFEEIIPSMNDVFIKAVQESNQLKTENNE